MPDITITLTTLISIISVGCAVYFGIKSKKRADDEETVKKAGSVIRLEEKIDTLTKSFSDFATDIKLEIRDMRKNFDDVKTQQAKQEATIESILNRLDKLEGT
mgnify:FL=1